MSPKHESLSHQIGFVLGTFVGIFITLWHAAQSKHVNSQDLKNHLHQFTDNLPEAVDDLVDIVYQRKQS